MEKKKDIKDYIDRREPTGNLQARVPISLLQETKRRLKRENISVTAFLKACLIKYLAESK